VYQFRGFFDVVGWFDVVLKSKYAVFPEAFVDNGVLVFGGKTCARKISHGKINRKSVGYLCHNLLFW
jgi:hypothetical protein